jgi:hypothetical protein
VVRVIVTGGETITGRENFKRWVPGFLAKVDDLHREVVESFQNADGSRVASRWLLSSTRFVKSLPSSRTAQTAVPVISMSCWSGSVSGSPWRFTNA